MSILVTGGAGFIGSHLVEHLVGRRDEVVVLDNLNDYYDPKLKDANLSNFVDSPAVTFVEGDIRNTELLARIFSEHTITVVVHLAARAGVRASLEQPLLYEQVNCGGTLTLLEAMRKHEVKRLVFASSSSVYGGSAEPPFREDAAIVRPLSPYAATKASGELICRCYHALYGISCTALRFFTVYGARQRPDMAIRKFTALIDGGEPIPFYGDGSSERDYTYYTDIVDGVTAAIDNDLGFEIINLGESKTTRLSRLVELLEKHLGKKAVLKKLPEQIGDMKATCADVSKAKRLLNYSPTTPIEAGIAAFVHEYQSKR